HIRMVISAVSCAAVIPMIVCASLISITKLEWNPREKVIQELMAMVVTHSEPH
ncbi:DRAM1 isoform 1, partial [Pongo abelii]